jgi:hypothetical protein
MKGFGAFVACLLLHSDIQTDARETEGLGGCSSYLSHIHCHGCGCCCIHDTVLSALAAGLRSKVTTLLALRA